MCEMMSHHPWTTLSLSESRNSGIVTLECAHIIREEDLHWEESGVSVSSARQLTSFFGPRMLLNLYLRTSRRSELCPRGWPSRHWEWWVHWFICRSSYPDAPALWNRVNRDHSDHMTLFHCSSLYAPQQTEAFSSLISGFLKLHSCSVPGPFIIKDFSNNIPSWKMLVPHYPPDFNNMLDNSLPNFSSFCISLDVFSGGYRTMIWLLSNTLTSFPPLQDESLTLFLQKKEAALSSGQT